MEVGIVMEKLLSKDHKSSMSAVGMESELLSAEEHYFKTMFELELEDVNHGCMFVEFNSKGEFIRLVTLNHPVDIYDYEDELNKNGLSAHAYFHSLKK